MITKRAPPGPRPTAYAPPDVIASRAPPGPVAPRGRWRVRRGPAVAELLTPPLAVWAGEVLLLVGPEAAPLLAVASALGAGGGARVRVAYVSSATPAGADALVAGACRSAAVVAVVPLPATRRGQAAVEALRRAVARVAPCRCVRLDEPPDAARVVPLPGAQ